MGSILQRGLFWRVYLTLLASLVLVIILTAIAWHSLFFQPMTTPVNHSSAALSVLFPPAGAPQAQTEDALRRLSTALGGRVLLVDPAGRPVAAAQDGVTQSPPPSMHVARRSDLATVWRSHLADGRSLVLAQRIRRGEGGPHVLGVLVTIAAAVGLAAFPVVSLLTRRLERLRASLDAWGAGKLDVRAPLEGQDEIAAVAASFNAAADRVEALLAAHKALLAHASHELRSPLTRLRMAVELFVSRPDPALYPDIVADIAELDGLVDEILFASRLDHATDLPDRETVDLLALAAEEAARAGATMAPVQPGAVFEIEGSSRWLRRMIRNLIENAIRHGEPPVEVELGGADGSISITVRDHGPGIPEAERERVFEPFYRPSGRGEAAGSWGLGLSIVRQIAMRHGGSVSSASGPDGARFTVRLPVRPLHTGQRV